MGLHLQKRNLSFHFSMVMYAIYVLLTLCLFSTVFGYPDVNARQNKQAKAWGQSSTLPSLRKLRQAIFGLFGKDLAIHKFIVGGKDAALGKWPWMALIFLEEDVKREVLICGASLISEQTVLTAAHCFTGMSKSKFIVRLGEHNLAETRAKNRPVEIKVKKIVTHSNFRPPSLYNDIAILHLEFKVRLTNMIQPVCLPKGFEAETFVDKKAYVTGWGNLKFRGNRSDTLQELILPVIPNGQCQKKYEPVHGSRMSLPSGINNSMMCAGIENERKASCQGDSGGPLVFQIESTNWRVLCNWIQIGIVSAGVKCGAGIPELYTRVTAYLNWIAENTI